MPERERIERESPNGATDEWDFQWEDLIDSIHEGRVVPVIGPELTEIAVDNEVVPLYRYFAEKLAAKMGVCVPATDPWGEWSDDASGVGLFYAVVGACISEAGGSREEVRRIVHRIVERDLPDSVLEPLTEFAGIDAFSLVITTAIDGLLAKAIEDRRGASQLDVRYYSPGVEGALTDLPESYREKWSPEGDQSRPKTVVQLLGGIGEPRLVLGVPEHRRVEWLDKDVVLTEADLLNWLVQALEPQTRPEVLLGELRHRDLLLIGLGYPDWLTRFFLRAFRGTPFDRGGNPVHLADSGLAHSAQKPLVAFLKGRKREVRIISHGGNPSDARTFVRELARRCMQRQAAPVCEGTYSHALEFEAGSVFVSYSRCDEEAACRIAGRIQEEEGVNAWLDRQRLEPGSEFDKVIKSAIGSASVFVPVISSSALQRRDAYFYSEWYEARLLRTRRPLQEFILPVIIDDTPPEHPKVTEFFKGINAAQLEHGELSEAFVRKIVELVERNQEFAEQNT